METANDWFKKCHVHAKIFFSFADTRFIARNPRLLNLMVPAVEKFIAGSPWLITGKSSSKPATIRVKLDPFDARKLELELKEYLRPSQLYAFHNYIEGIVTELAQTLPPQILGVSGWLEIRSESVHKAARHLPSDPRNDDRVEKAQIDHIDGLISGEALAEVRAGTHSS